MEYDTIVVATQEGNTDSIAVTAYRCTATQKVVVTNRSGAPLSPFDGKPMERTDAQAVQATASDIENNMVDIATCPTCESHLNVGVPTAKAIIASVQENGDFPINCVVCGETVKVTAANIGDVTAAGDDSEGDEDDEVPAEDDDTPPEGDDDDDDADAEEGDEDEGEDSDDDNDNDNDDDEANSDDDDWEQVPDDEDENSEREQAPVEASETEDDETTPVVASATGVDVQDTTVIHVNAFEAVASSIKEQNLVLLPVNPDTALVLSSDSLPLFVLRAGSATETNKALFSKPEKLADAFVAVMASDDFKVTADCFKEFGGEPVGYTVKTPDFIKQRISQGVTAAETSVEAERTHLLNDMRQCLSIAGIQLFKNLDTKTPNPLRGPLVAAMKSNGVNSPEHLVDSIFHSTANDFLSSLIATATELQTKSLESRNEIGRYVSTAATLTVMPTEAAPAAPANDIAADLEDGNLTVNTVESTNTVAASEMPGAFDPKRIVKSSFARSRRR